MGFPAGAPHVPALTCRGSGLYPAWRLPSPGQLELQLDSSVLNWVWSGWRESSLQSCFRNSLSLNLISINFPYLFSKTGECVKEIPQICCQCCRKHFLTAWFFSTLTVIFLLLSPCTEFIAFKDLKKIYIFYASGLVFSCVFFWGGGHFFFLYQALLLSPHLSWVWFGWLSAFFFFFFNILLYI